MASDEEQVLHADAGEVLGMAIEQRPACHGEQDLGRVRKGGSKARCPPGCVDDSGFHVRTLRMTSRFGYNGVSGE
jgi:hypothetical protein